MTDWILVLGVVVIGFSFFIIMCLLHSLRNDIKLITNAIYTLIRTDIDRKDDNDREYNTFNTGH